MSGAAATKEQHHPPADLSLRWDDLTIGDWKNLLATAPQSNALLSWPVALATFATKRQRPHFGVFYEGTTPVALVVAHRWKFVFLEKISIHRGPLWLIDSPTQQQIESALTALKNTFVKSEYRRPFQRFSFLPELRDTAPARRALENTGFKQTRQPPYASLMLDITPAQSLLEKGLKKGWRSALKKSRKNKLRYTVDHTRPGYKLFLRGYRRDKTLKKYPGPSILFLLNLRKHANRNELLLLEAWHDGQLVAGQLFICHGRTVTYLVGWTTPEGRVVAAHNGLLFDAAIAELKKRKMTALDLGGLTENAPTLNQFKEGMGGTPYTLAGAWRL